MDGLALKPRYSDVVQLEQPVFEVILDDCGTGLQTVLEGEYDLILFVCGLQPWEKEDSLRAIRFLGAEEGLQILLNHRKCGRDYLPEEVRYLKYLRLPFLTPPFDAGGRRGQENEAAEETEFLKDFREAALKKDGGPDRQQKKGDSGGTSGEGGSALWVDSRGSGNRRKYRLESENGAKAQKWGENSGKNQCQTQSRPGQNAWNVSG